MYAAVNETAKLISPLAEAISSVTAKLINAAVDRFIEAPRREKALNQLVYVLKIEYPFETDDYLTHMALSMYEEAR